MRAVPSPEELEDIIQAVRKQVQAEQDVGLKCSTSDEFLLRFIKASHYNKQVSFDLVKKYFVAKVDNPEAFIVQSPADNLLMLKRRDLGFPLKQRDKCGRRVLHLKFGLIDPSKESWKSVIQTTMMILEAFSLEEDVQELGIAMILDCADFSLRIMKWATPNKIKILLGFFQECIPLRFEAVHLVNYPYIFHMFYSALSPFMHEETKRKVLLSAIQHPVGPYQLIWHNQITSLEECINKPFLPKDLGGELQFEDVENWYKIVLEREEIFSEFRKMGYEKRK